MTKETWNCPLCGEPLKENAVFCPHCGSDSETGWSEDTYLDGADWIHEEWEPEDKKKGSSVSLLVLGILVVVVIILSILR